MIWPTIKKALKKLWWFIWEDESIWSWLVNIVLAFILIKFIVYPGLGLLFGTAFPVVAVVSGSMEHDGSFDDWWNSETAICSNGRCDQRAWYLEHDIEKEEFLEYPFKSGFNKGDIMVLLGVEPENIKMGDIIVFQSQEKADPIIHRVTEIEENEGYIFQTKGDHNPTYGPIDKDIIEDNIYGRAVLRIPLLGWIKIAFVSLLQYIGIV